MKSFRLILLLLVATPIYAEEAHQTYRYAEIIVSNDGHWLVVDRKQEEIYLPVFNISSIHFDKSTNDARIHFSESTNPISIDFGKINARSKFQQLLNDISKHSSSTNQRIGTPKT